MTEDFFLKAVGMFLIALVRFSGFFINLPAFGESIVPARNKAAISALCALIMLPHLLKTQKLPQLDPLGYGIMAFRELIIGISIGFIVLIFVDALKFAGEIIGMQIGFSFIQVVNPESTKSEGVVSEFFHSVGVLLFLILEGHVIILLAFAESFDLIPLSKASINAGVVSEIAELTSILFRLGLKISLPIIAIILIGDIALGIIAKTVPRMNIFQVGFPIKILLGLLTITFMLPFMADLITNLYNQAYGHINSVLNFMAR